MRDRKERLQIWLATLPWYRLPPVLYFLIGSPILTWCGVGKKWFQWPHRPSDLDGPTYMPHWIDVVGFYVGIIVVLALLVAVA